MKNKVVVTLLLIAMGILSGCTSVQHMPLSAEHSANIKGKSLVASNYEKPDFAAMTAGKAMFAMIGAAAMISAGNTVVNENNIPDPAVKITELLTQNLQKAKGMKIQKITNASTAPAKEDGIEYLINHYNGTDYILDVKTFNWNYAYYPTDWTHYRVNYSARLRLIDTGSKQVVAETLCQGSQGDDNNPPTEAALLNNNAELLKKYLDKAAVACADILSKEILRI